MMIKRNQRILAKNRQLTESLEDQVAVHTQKLNALLDERREFFYQLAHNLKAPISATNHYVQLIKMHRVDIDEELLQYIDLINEKHLLLSERAPASLSLSQSLKMENATYLNVAFSCYSCNILQFPVY